MYSKSKPLTHKTTNNHCKIGAYLRISQDDGMDIESNSIKNQREIIKSYIDGREEFKGALVTDYIDDGISGSHSEREAYQRLLSDIERGAIDCVIVKDLSRIGRNMIDVDDLLMNHLVTLNVRFVAINNAYDSFSNPLSNLELAVINLANQHYNKDLAEKSIAAKRIKAKRGEYLAHAPYGYKKSTQHKNKLVPDDEAANVVRLIYSLACEGRRSIEIAQILNAQGIPSPSVYKIRNGWSNMWTHVIDPDYCFWTRSVIYKLIKNEVYIGKAISNKFKVIEPSTGRIKPRPQGEWIIVPNAHEPLVSESDFTKAQLVLPRQKKERKYEHVFGNKVKCPTCGHAMIRTTPKNPHFKCGTAQFTSHYGCKVYTILQSAIEDAVLASIQMYVDILLDREEIKLTQLQKSESSIKELERKIAIEMKAVELLELSITKIFMDFSSEKITKEIFQNKKGVINETVARKRSDIEKWTGEIKAVSDEHASAEKAIAELTPLLTIEKLDRDIVNLLIDKILVHSEKDIEIVWNGKFSSE